MTIGETRWDLPKQGKPKARQTQGPKRGVGGVETRDERKTRRLHRRSLRLPTRRKWAQSGYLCTTPSTAQAGADAGISWS